LRKLYGLEIDLTAKCFSGCSYCYAGSIREWDTSRELSLEEKKHLIDTAIEGGLKSFSWAGGEPLLCLHWHELLKYTKRKSGKNFLASTLSLATPKIAEQLVDVVDNLLFHFDSISKKVFLQTHPLGRPDEYENSLKGLHMLLDAGFNPKKIHLSFPIVKPLISTAKDTFDFFLIILV